MVKKTKEQRAASKLARIKEIYDEVDALDLADGTHWTLVAERVQARYPQMDHADVIQFIGDNISHFGGEEIKPS